MGEGSYPHLLFVDHHTCYLKTLTWFWISCSVSHLVSPFVKKILDYRPLDWSRSMIFVYRQCAWIVFYLISFPEFTSTYISFPINYWFQTYLLSFSAFGFLVLMENFLSWLAHRREENSFEREPLPSEPPAKRVCTISPAPRHSPALMLPVINPAGQFHPTPPPLQHYTLEDIATSHLYRDPSKALEHRELRDRHGIGKESHVVFKCISLSH